MFKNKITIIFLSIILVLSLGIAGCSNGSTEPAASDSDEVIKIKLAHFINETSPYHQLAVRFKELVEKESNGKVSIDIYPNGLLGDERTLPEALQFGNIDMAVLTMSPMISFVPETGALDMPYLFESWDDTNKFIGSDVYNRMLAACEEQGFTNLGMFMRGFRYVGNKEFPINKASDMKGLKIRVVQSPVYVKLFEQYGANVSAMAWSEAFTALQQGALDSCENTIVSGFLDCRIYEVNKYISETRHMAPWTGLFISKNVLDTYPEDIQQIIKDCGEQAVAEIHHDQEVQEAKVLDDLQTVHGMVFNEVEDIESFKAGKTAVYDWFKAEYGDAVYQYVVDIQELLGH